MAWFAGRVVAATSRCPGEPPASAPSLLDVSSVRRPPVCLTIAGSDSGGGAGVQADLKAFAACGAHGASALTALTAQSTVAVTGVHAVPPAFIVEQVRAVIEDLGVDAVKLGMLGDAVTIAAVAEALTLVPAEVPMVLDPVMVAESGARLLDPDAVRALVERLVPRATVVTPNLPEARVLAEIAARGDAVADRGARTQSALGEVAPGATGEAAALARAIHGLGPRAVIVTGGHRDRVADLLFDGAALIEIPGPRHADGAAHGSGCTHASALAAHLAHGFSLQEAAFAARVVAGESVRRGLRAIGAGAGPVDVLGVLDRTPLRPGA